MNKVIFSISFCLALVCNVHAQAYSDNVVPVIGGIRGDEITMQRDLLLSQDSIRLSKPGYQIVSYEFSCENDYGLIAYSVRGSKITDKIKLLIKSGDTRIVYFSDFTINSKNGHPVPALRPIQITIVD